MFVVSYLAKLIMLQNVLLDRLKSLDIEVMKQLHHKVNIIPLIAKADTMTADECRDFKKTVSCSICLASADICLG